MLFNLRIFVDIFLFFIKFRYCYCCCYFYSTAENVWFVAVNIWIIASQQKNVIIDSISISISIITRFVCCLFFHFSFFILPVSVSRIAVRRSPFDSNRSIIIIHKMCVQMALVASICLLSHENAMMNRQQSNKQILFGWRALQNELCRRLPYLYTSKDYNYYYYYFAELWAWLNNYLLRHRGTAGILRCLV